jgi:predicted 3-demethylubiquinone-9 3-methyltransferase (glyoxalase superfamily)
MSAKITKIVPNLWFDTQAEEAARFYTSVFPNSSLGRITRYGKAGHEIHGMEEDTVMTVGFSLDGQEFLALNGGPVFKFSEAISFIINCDTQEEADYYWDKLTEGGDLSAQQCGWLKDKFGVPWQVIPTAFTEMMNDPNPERSERMMEAMLKMKKLDIWALKKARDGN